MEGHEIETRHSYIDIQDDNFFGRKKNIKAIYLYLSYGGVIRSLP